MTNIKNTLNFSAHLNNETCAQFCKLYKDACKNNKKIDLVEPAKSNFLFVDINMNFNNNKLYTYDDIKEVMEKTNNVLRRHFDLADFDSSA